YPAPQPPTIYTLSLHYALPISYRHHHHARMLRRCINWVTGGRQAQGRALASQSSQQTEDPAVMLTDQPQTAPIAAEEQPREQSRSEEHTSELQSRENLVCRLLL